MEFKVDDSLTSHGNFKIGDYVRHIKNPCQGRIEKFMSAQIGNSAVLVLWDKGGRGRYFPYELRKLSPLDVLAACKDSNDRRIDLIQKKSLGSLSREEESELNQLQLELYQRQDALFPLPEVVNE